MGGRIESLLSVMLTLATAVTLSGQDRSSQQGPPSDAAQAARTAPDPPQIGKRANWQAVQSLSSGHKIEVVLDEGEKTRGAFVSASDAAVVVRAEGGERSIARQDVRRVRAHAPSRRTRNGLIATAAGAGIGLAIGYAVCPQCPNEGAAGKYIGPLTAAAAGVGAAAGFLAPPYKTVYKRK